ncbi:MAG: response regulator [Mariniblastus sp.]|nr:response regulator [Mariniblastus sp.]
MNDENTILVVDDDDVLRSRLEKAFSSRGLVVYTASDYDEAIELARANSPDMAVLDLKMPGRGGMELLREIKQLSPSTKVVMLTGYGSITNAVEAVKLGALNYITKPADADQVLGAFGAPAEPIEPAEFPPPSLASAEWEHIQRVLADCGGNISEAARRLDIPRRTLQRKLKKNAP